MDRSRHYFFLACLFFAVVGNEVSCPSLASAAQLGPLLNQDLLINTTTALPSQSEVAFDGSRYLIVFNQNFDTTSYYDDLYGRFVDTSGNMGPLFLIAHSPGNQRYSAVAFNGTNYLVVWQDDLGGYMRVKGQLVSPGGELLGDEIQIHENTDSRYPEVASDGEGFLVVWDDGRNGTTNPSTTHYRDIFGQIIRGDGSLNGANFLISPGPENQIRANVAFGSSTYLVTWTNQPDFYSYERDVYGALVSPTGTASSPIAISTAPGSQGGFTGISFGSNNFLVVFENYTSSPVSLFGARVSEAGVVLDGPSEEDSIAISEVLAGEAAAAFDGTNWLVLSTGINVPAIRVSLDGVVLDPTEMPTFLNVSLAYEPAVAFDGTNFLVTARTYYTNQKYAQLVGEGPPNQAPVAVDDDYSVDEDTTLIVPPEQGTLSNDSDLEGDTLTAVMVSAPSNGTLTLKGDGSFAYTPAPNFYGNDSFTYKANDASSDSNTATVSIVVNPVNDNPMALDDSYSGDEDLSIVVLPPQSVLNNDSDIDDDALTVVLENGPSHGTLSLNPDGSFTYTPEDNFNGYDSFTYRADDGFGLLSNVATVNIMINPLNDVPVALADNYVMDEDTVIDISQEQGVLSNDYDHDGDFLTAVLEDGPSHGTLSLNPDGSFTYTPENNFNGYDSFTYRADDGFGLLSGTATVTITVKPVNDFPLALSDGPFFGVEGLSVSMDASASSDVEESPLAYIWEFGDGSTLTTTEAIVEHTYSGAGTFTVELVVNDGELNSQPFITEANIVFSGGGQRSDVDAFLAWQSPLEKSTFLQDGTTNYRVEIFYGETIDTGTFQATLNGEIFNDFHPVANTVEAVDIPLSSGRNVLFVTVEGIRTDGRIAKDRDRMTFIIP